METLRAGHGLRHVKSRAREAQPARARTETSTATVQPGHAYTVGVPDRSASTRMFVEQPGIKGRSIGSEHAQPAMRTGMNLMMGAVGLRGVAAAAPEDGGIELAVKTVAMAVRTTLEKTLGMTASFTTSSRGLS